MGEHSDCEGSAAEYVDDNAPGVEGIESATLDTDGFNEEDHLPKPAAPAAAAAKNDDSADEFDEPPEEPEKVPLPRLVPEASDILKRIRKHVEDERQNALNDLKHAQAQAQRVNKTALGVM